MAPQKRKSRSDDLFYHTIYDDDEIEDETDEEETAPKSKKTKTSNDDQISGDLDPNFQFFDDTEVVDVDTTGLEWTGANTAVDLDSIIKRRLEKKENPDADEAESDFGGFEDDDGFGDSEEEEEVDLEGLVDLDEEALAEDGFGMGANSEEEEEADDDENDSDGGGEDDDDSVASDDSVATPTGHPGDRDDDDDGNESVSSEEDSEEAARQKAFFADGEKEKAKVKAGKKGKNGSAGGGSGPGSFLEMRLFSPPILRGISAAGFSVPTEIQARTIPFGMRGKDLVAQAITGSGKTAAFLLPILERLLFRPNNVPTTRVVILTPARELAMQCHKVAAKLASFTSITMALAVGGTSFKSSEANLRSRPDIVIGTPGRFIDHMRNSPNFAVDRVEILVLDEADRMLQDGFADELNEIVKTLPRRRQTMLFSATMGTSVDSLIRVGLTMPVRIRAGQEDDDHQTEDRTAATLTQEFVRLKPSREAARMGTLVQLCTKLYRDHAIIFFREKKYIHEARIVFVLLGLSCVELHGDMKQAERTQALESFRHGAVNYLLASDLASRGLDIQGVQTVINYEVPKTTEDYIHRIGRTARAGRRGVAVTIVTEKDRPFVKAALKVIRGKRSAGKKKVKKSELGIVLRPVDPVAAEEWQAKIDALEDDVAAIIKEEYEARAAAKADMEATRAQNLLLHHDDIMSRPKKTWFETPRDKEIKKKQEQKERRDGGKAAKGGKGDETSVDKLRERLKHRTASGQLSNKDRKRLDLKAERIAGMGGRKLKQEKKAIAATIGRGKPGKPGKPGKAGKANGKGKPRR